jgi:3-oxocholest-4-en-26-oate---CoA ligase
MEYNLADLFESIVEVLPENPALVCGNRTLTYAELDTRANKLAMLLQSRGVKKGDHVGLHLFNGTEYVEGMLAALKLRAVPININYRYVAEELKYLFDNADLVALISQQEFTDIVQEAASGLDDLNTFVFLQDGSDKSWPDENCFDYDNIIETHSGDITYEPRSGKDLFIIYTGGTTGMPKGVMWQHEDVFFAGLQGGAPGGEPIESPEELAQHAKEENYTQHMLPAAPFIHGAAQWTTFIGLFTGGKIGIQEGRSFSAEKIWKLAENEDLNTLTIVGDAMALPLIEELKRTKYNTDNLYTVASAGAILSATVQEELQKLLPDVSVLNNFGSSETGHQGAAFSDDDEEGDSRPTFYMDESNTVLGDDMKPIEPGSGVMGKLARSGRIPLGYYKDKEKTAQRFVEADGQRWVMPGDFATIQEDGSITVFGRGSVCINTGGEKVFPEEVEEALKGHPDVYDTLVVGLPDEKWMQKVAAVIQLRPGKEANIDSIDAYCRKKVAGYKVPRFFTFADEVARMPSGKPDYRWAKEYTVAKYEESQS